MKIVEASSFGARLRGLLGTQAGDIDFDLLHLKPCKSIHTFGMNYALDVAFLDSKGRVIKVCRNLPPCRLCSAPRRTASVLERPAQPEQRRWLFPGQSVFKEK